MSILIIGFRILIDWFRGCLCFVPSFANLPCKAVQLRFVYRTYQTNDRATYDSVIKLHTDRINVKYSRLNDNKRDHLSQLSSSIIILDSFAGASNVAERSLLLEWDLMHSTSITFALFQSYCYQSYKIILSFVAIFTFSCNPHFCSHNSCIGRFFCSSRNSYNVAKAIRNLSLTYFKYCCWMYVVHTQ